MKFLRLLVVAVLLVVAFLIVDRNYGSYSVIYECSGTVIKKSGLQNPITLLIRLTQYRWWRVTASVAGTLRLEIPVGTPVSPRTDLFAIKRISSHLNLYRWPKAGEIGDFTGLGQGQFSTISGALTLNISDDEQFQGGCKPKNN